jgi:hypothetical protein
MFQLLSILSFLLRLQYKVFHSTNLHSHSVCSWLHPCIFFNFFETLKYQFHKNSKKGLQGAWAPKRFSDISWPFPTASTNLYWQKTVTQINIGFQKAWCCNCNFKHWMFLLETKNVPSHQRPLKRTKSKE